MSKQLTAFTKITLFIIFLAANLYAQQKLQFPFKANLSGETAPYLLNIPETQAVFNGLFIKKPGHYSRDDWQHVIDSTWGPGLPTKEKLDIFDNFWTAIDTGFACFHNLPLNWDSLRALYRPEIANGVSKGRFCAIINHIALLLKEPHTAYAYDYDVVSTPLNPGVPLFCVSGLGNNSFGAGLTPLPDSSLLVYSVLPNHPLGLQRGDIVLGYDRIPWKVLYKELLEFELPIRLSIWIGGSPSGFTHSMLRSAGRSWHLYDTIDIVKYSSGDTIHLPTSLMVGQNTNLVTTEQMDIPGVLKPVPPHVVSYGIISGTNIGYIYCWFWTDNAEQEFLDAVQSLMQTDGLIIDFRFNGGGNMFLSNAGLSLLFDSSVATIDFGKRCSPVNHQQMCPENISGQFVIPGASPGYNKPIAVLTGPGAVSSGDQVALRLKFHPRARFFGKTTSTAFNSPISPDIYPNWHFNIAVKDAYKLSDPNHYLTHEEFPVDENVWFTPNIVAQGRDDVVEAAVNWITTIGITNIGSEVPQWFNLEQNYPNPFNPVTKIRFEIAKSQLNSSGTKGPLTKLVIYDILGKEVTTLVNEQLAPGKYEVDWNASGSASGAYFYRLSSGDFRQTKKMLLIK